MYKVLIESGRIDNVINESIMDGFYYIQIFPEKAKTLKDYQKQLFSIVDEFCQNTGNSRYQVWQSFKDEQEITSSREIALDKFPEVLESLKFFLMQKL